MEGGRWREGGWKGREEQSKQNNTKSEWCPCLGLIGESGIEDIEGTNGCAKITISEIGQSVLGRPLLAAVLKIPSLSVGKEIGREEN